LDKIEGKLSSYTANTNLSKDYDTIAVKGEVAYLAVA
jgi:hypothetical protein